MCEAIVKVQFKQLMGSVSGGLSIEHCRTSTDMGYLTQSWEVKEGFPEEVLFCPVLKS